MNTLLLIGILAVIIAAGAGTYYIASHQLTSPQTQTITTSITTTTHTPYQTQTTISTSSTVSSIASTTGTTTQTTSGSKSITTQKISFIGLVRHFKHVGVEVEIHNGTTGEVTTNTFSYSRSKTSLNGETVFLININYNSTEGDEGSIKIWLSHDYSRVLQLKLGDQVLTGQMAEFYGNKILQTIDKAFFATMSYNLQFQITEGTTQAIMHGWIVNTLNPIQITISGHTYPGYYYKVTNINDAESNTAWAEGKIAEIINEQYYHVYMKVAMKNGDVFTVKFTDLEV
jgi:hypothetical protein